MSKLRHWLIKWFASGYTGMTSDRMACISYPGREGQMRVWVKPLHLHCKSKLVLQVLLQFIFWYRVLLYSSDYPPACYLCWDYRSVLPSTPMPDFVFCIYFINDIQHLNSSSLGMLCQGFIHSYISSSYISLSFVTFHGKIILSHIERRVNI